MPEILRMSLQLVLAGVLGGLVGYEREIHDRPAGLRTHVLVCLGAALMTLVSTSFSSFGSDPSRVAAQIVSGIGFLGAGTILRQGSVVRGLTTAASLWTVAGIGMAVGVGGRFYVLAVIATLIVFLTLSVMRSLEFAGGKQTGHQLYLEIPSEETGVLPSVLQKLTDSGASINSVRLTSSRLRETKAYRLALVLPAKVKAEEIARVLSDESGIRRFEWE